MKERMIPYSSFDSFINEQSDVTIPLKDQLEQFEASYIKHVLKKNDYNISKSAKLLGLSLQSLQYRMKKLHIETKMD